MACCQSTATWECCYPDVCSCDTCCCQEVSCGVCNDANPRCGTGACCTCNSNEWGYAWKDSFPCGLTAFCGDFLYFNKPSQACNLLWSTTRKDTHNPAASSIADFTKSFFTEFAPLAQGVVSIRVSNDATCC